MKRLLFSLLAFWSGLMALAQADTAKMHIDTLSVNVPDQPWQKHLDRYHRFWAALMPDGLRIQTAGNMGVVSMGPVWVYGKSRQWETALTFGIVPKHQANNALMTMTIKEDYIPWSIRRGQLEFHPLATGLYVNTVFSDKFWTHQPHRYPKGYYWFSTRMRANVYLGERLTLNIPDHRRKFSHQVKVFYELSTCDFYLIQAVKNDYITPDKILSLSLGVQFVWL